VVESVEPLRAVGPGGRIVEYPPPVRVTRLRQRNSDAHHRVMSSPSQSDARRRDAMTSLVRATPTNTHLASGENS